MEWTLSKNLFQLNDGAFYISLATIKANVIFAVIFEGNDISVKRE
jgi:hypothetical protein